MRAAWLALLLLFGIAMAQDLVSSKLVSEHLRVLETAAQELRQCEATKKETELLLNAQIAALRERILELEYQLLNKECTPARIYPCPMNGNSKLLSQQDPQVRKKHTDLRLLLQDFAHLRNEDFLVIGFVAFVAIKFVLATWSQCWPTTRNPPRPQQQVWDTGTELVEEEEHEAPSTPTLSFSSSPTIPTTPIQRPNFNDDKPITAFSTPRSRRAPTTSVLDRRSYSTPRTRHTSIERSSQRREEIEQRRRLTTNDNE